jgi:hypothetical protein
MLIRLTQLDRLVEDPRAVVQVIRAVCHGAVQWEGCGGGVEAEEGDEEGEAEGVTGAGGLVGEGGEVGGEVGGVEGFGCEGG